MYLSRLFNENSSGKAALNIVKMRMGRVRAKSTRFYAGVSETSAVQNTVLYRSRL